MKCEIKFRLCVPSFVSLILCKFQVMGKICRKSGAFLLKLTTLGLGARRIYFTYKQPNWDYHGLRKLVDKICFTHSDDHIKSSGRPRTIRVENNFKKVLKLALSSPGKSDVH